MSRVLSTAASEPSVIRWLHALDPDRNLSGELLRSSVRYTTMLAASEEAKPGMPRETASLFIPMYRRGSLVLGQLYGPMSPNTLALAGLCAPQPPPTPRSRRFVVDLASTNPIEFVEYEWFTDGKLAVSLHDMTEDGVYSGQTIIFDGKAAPGSPVPSRVAMRLYYSEAPQSGRTPLPPDWRDRLSSWESWTRQFASLRAGSTRVTVRFTVPRPDELPIQGERITNLTEECAVGECGFQMSSANKLVRMFLQAAGMFVSHPSQDQPVADSADRRAFTDAVKALYDEDDREATLEEFLSPDTEPMGAETSSALVPSPLSPQKTATSTAALPVERSPPIQPSALSAPAVSLLDPVAPDAAPPPKTVDAPPAVKSPAPPNVAAPTAVTSRPAYAGISKPGAREHVCECGMRFSHRGHFNAHRRAVHEKIRPHKCSYQSCESSFAKRSDLLRHQLSQHSEEVRFECSQCSVNFPDKAQLALHFAALHDHDRPYKCPLCAKGYSTRSGLRKHRHTKHPHHVDDTPSQTPATGSSDSDGQQAPNVTVQNGSRPLRDNRSPPSLLQRQ